MTLQDVINTESGQFIKDFYASVSGKVFENKTGKGKLFWSTTLRDNDSGAEVKATFWHHNPGQFGNNVIHFDGMGMKRTDDYNGTAQISIGDKAELKATGDRGSSAGVAPSQNTATSALDHTKRPPAASQVSSRPSGQRNGMRDGMLMHVAMRKHCASEFKISLMECFKEAEAVMVEVESGGAAPQDSQPPPRDTQDYSASNDIDEDVPF